MLIGGTSQITLQRESRGYLGMDIILMIPVEDILNSPKHGLRNQGFLLAFNSAAVQELMFNQAATCVGMEELCLNWSALDTLVHIAATFSVFANSMRFAMIFSSGNNFTFRCFIMDVIFF